MVRNFFIGMLLLSLGACSSQENGNKSVPPMGPMGGSFQSGSNVIPAVEAVKSQYGSLPLMERFSGNVTSENQIELFPEISAQIAEVFVENGDKVAKGQILVRLQDENIKKQLQQAEAGLRINVARLKQAEAKLAELQNQYNRTQILAQKDLTSQLQLEQIESQKATAEADVELAKAQIDQSEALVDERKVQLSKTVIKSPIAGTVGQKNARVGMQATPGTKIFTIGDLTKLRIEIVLTEDMLNYIKVGQTATIYAPDQEDFSNTITAKLSRISPFLNEITRSTEAEIDVDNTDEFLKPGMFVPVDIHYGESQQATLIPTSAIFINPKTGKEGIYIAGSIGSEIKPVSDDSESTTAFTEPTPVSFKEIDIIARGKMEVGVAGLESGKWVVTLGQNLLAQGREVARVRTMNWEHVLRLQSMQKEDLLRQIMNLDSNRESKGVSL